MIDHQKILDAYEIHGSERKAAKALNLPKTTFRRYLQKALDAPMFPANSSTMLDADGNVKLQWVRTPKSDPLEAIRLAVDSLKDEIKPEQRTTKQSETSNHLLLNTYIITDYHLGALAWGEETRGEDWDSEIAENLLVNWFAKAIEQAPNAHKAVFAQLGDFLHWDGLDAVTPTSGHVLDADTRYQHVIRIAIRVIRRIVRMLLEKHQEVYLLMAEGNHDLASSAWLRELFTALYEDEPRVTVDDSPDPYYCVEHGKTSIFFHHGHKRKPTNIDTVFAAKFREVFGRTKHSYAHMGHYHHNHAIETNLMQVEQHRTLAAADSHASRGGWISGRDAKVVTYHSEHGRVGTLEISPEMCL